MAAEKCLETCMQREKLNDEMAFSISSLIISSLQWHESPKGMGNCCPPPPPQIVLVPTLENETLSFTAE